MKKHKTLLGWLAALFVSVGSADLSAQNNSPASPQGGPSVSGSTASNPTPASSEPNQRDEVVLMSQFEVTTTQGHGYVSTNAATAFKTDEPLMDIPQGDIVITNDFIQAIGYENSTDVLQFFGVSNVETGEYMSLRGDGTAYTLPYVDEMQEHDVEADSAIIDSYELIKGPSQEFYLDAPISGVVLKATKKPLPFQQEVLSASIDQFGVFRVMADSTGPIGRIGDLKLGYRFVGVYQRGDPYFYNITDNRTLLFPEFQVNYHNTAVRIYYNYLRINGQQEGQGFDTPAGKLYTGGGYRDASNQPPDNMVVWEERSLFAEVLQKISDTWENRVSAQYWNYTDFGRNSYPIEINYDNNTESFVNLLTDRRYHFWTVLDDWQGHYDLGPSGYSMTNHDAFGFAFSSQVKKSSNFSAPYPYPNGPVGGLVTIPIGSVAAINSITMPPLSAYAPPSSGSIGNDTQTQLSEIYLQHTIAVIPNWLTLIAGFTWDNIASQQIGNFGVLPFNGTVASVSQWVHRLAAVVHVTNNVSLYALDSTSFVPPPLSIILANGQTAPNQGAKGDEGGIKWNFLGGKISGEAAYFRQSITNGINDSAGTFPNGIVYGAVIGGVTEVGVDGDAAFTVVPGWQMIGSWYAGHENDPTGNPVPNSYDNSWSLFSRYDFDRKGPLRGLGIGGGVTRIGGRWMNSDGLIYTKGYLPENIKLETGTEVNAFAEYRFEKHWILKVNCSNVLNQAFVYGNDVAYISDPSPPRTFSLMVTFSY